MATEALQIDALWSGITKPTNGKAYSGAIVATFESGTSTPKAVWTNKEKTTPSALGQAQFTLDSNGQAFVFGDGAYKINIYAPTDTLLTNPLITIDGANYNVGATEDTFEYDHNSDGSHINFDTVAALRASSLTPFDGQEVVTFGAVSFNDGGGGKWVWNASSTVTDNTGTVVKQASLVTGRWERVIEDVYTIDAMWFGAVAGAINDTAINAAIAYATTEMGQTLHIPESLIATTIVVDKEDLTITSDGQPISFDASFTIIGSGDYGVYDVMFAATVDNVDFVDCVMKQGAYTEASVFIWYALGVDGGLVTKCKFYDLLYDPGVLGTAIQTRTSAINIRIVDNYFKNCKASVVTQGSFNVTDRNTSYNDNANGGHDAVFSINGGVGSSITNNKIYKNNATLLSGNMIDIQYTSEFLVSGNQINGLNGGVAIHAYDFGGGVKSTNGVISNNIISGDNLTALAPWNFIQISFGSGVEIIDNVLIKPPTASGASSAIVVTPDNNTVSGNIIDMADVAVNECIRIDPKASGTSGTLKIENNTMTSPTRGINLSGLGYNDHIPILLKGNTYLGTMTVAIDSAAPTYPTIPIYMENEYFLGASLGTGKVQFGKYDWMFNYGNAGNFPYRMTRFTQMYSSEVPNSVGYPGTTWEESDTIFNSAAAVGSPVGWTCTQNGTFSSATDATGDTDGSTAIITGMTDTSDFYIGEYVSVSAGFPAAGPYMIQAITATTITLDTASNSVQSNITVATIDAIWTAMANL
jgi:hypothetical protein